MTALRSLASEQPWTPLCEALARSVAHEFWFPGGEFDDVLQEARVGVAKALRDFEPGMGMVFKSFATMCARGQVVSALKGATTLKHRALNEARSLDEPMSSDDGEGQPFGARLLTFRPWDDPEHIVIVREEVLALLTRIQRLSPLERECVERCLIAGEEYDAVGARKRVDNALQRARIKLADETPAAGPSRIVRVYVDRRVYVNERQAVAAALSVRSGAVLSVTARKLLDGRDRAPQGRPDARGRCGQPVWRVELRCGSVAGRIAA